MIKHYLKYIIRNVKKNKLTATINVVGLTMGIASTLLIMLWIQYETNFDKFHTNINDLYRVSNQWDDGIFDKSCPGAAKHVLSERYPEIKNVSRYCNLGLWKVSAKNKHFKASFSYVDSSFFSMFSFITFILYPSSSSSAGGDKEWGLFIPQAIHWVFYGCFIGMKTHGSNGDQ